MLDVGIYKKKLKQIRLLQSTVTNFKKFYALVVKRALFEFAGKLRNTLFLHSLEVVQLRKYKDIYKGQHKRAFVVATGPSLTMEDLDKLKNEITFSVNGVFQLYDRTDWRPTYYGILDEFVYKRFVENGMAFHFDTIAKEHCFVDRSMKKKLQQNHENLEKVSFVPVYRFDHYIDFESRHFAFSPDLIRGHYSTWTVTNFAINLAIFMGIEEIYLLGVDCSYTGKKQYVNGVIDPKAMSQDAAYRTQQKMIDSYQFIRSKIEPLRIHVYNATRGGELEVFDRVSFDSLF